jgi:hypothetical protein
MAASVRLTAKAEDLLSRLSKKRGQTKSEVIRSALLQLAAEESDEARKRPYDAIKHLLGCASGGPPDLSVRTGARFRALLEERKRRE